MNRSQRALARVGVTVLGIASGLAGTGGVARADAAFSATASTTGVSVIVINDSLPLVTSVQVSVPSAIATLNSRGQGTAYAASPDPGHDFSELPSVLAGTACSSAPIPDCSTLLAAVPAYPVAYAQSGNAPQDVTLGPVQLHAEATGTGTTGRATDGATGEATATSTAHTQVAADSSVDASGTTDVDGLTLASYLSLSGIHSSASLHRTPDGTLTRKSSFTAGTITVAGQSFAFADGSFTLLGQLVPLPVPVQTVLDALGAVGVTATYLPADATATGITSAGLTLSYQAAALPSGLIPPLPPLPLPIGVGLPAGATTVSFTLGRSSASGTYKVIPAVDPSTGGSLTGLSTAPSSSPASAPATAPGATTSTPSFADSTASVGLSTVDPLASTPGTDPGSSPQVAAVTPAEAVRAAASAEPFTTDSVDIYLALVVAALAALGGATAIRFLGVRRAWSS